MTAKNVGDYVIPPDWGDEAEWAPSGRSCGRWGITDKELDEVIADLGRPEMLEPGFTLVGVWGRKSQ